MKDDRQQSMEMEDDQRYLVKLDVFEGPLDLLLHLIRKHELDIFDIPIGFITQEYLKHLDMMKVLNLDLASDYLEMAAHLVLVKSRMMLPEDPCAADDDMTGEDGPDPREELVRRLLEYQKYKKAADDLSDLPRMGRDTFPVGEDASRIPAGDREMASPGLFALMEALQKVFDRVGAQGSSDTEISITRVSISARIHQILDRLRLIKRMPFMDLFEKDSTRSDVVITFLAILEMTKLGLTKIHQAAPSAEIHITASAEDIDAATVLAETELED